MIQIKIKSTFIEAKRLIIKFIGFTKDDARTAPQAAPYGDDSNPIDGMRAIYCKTSSNGADVVIGYLNINALAQPGEKRLYSTDASGTEKTYVYLKNDGILELNGNSDFAVRYSKLEDAFNELQAKFNQFAAAYAPGGPSTIGTPLTVDQSTADISLAKIETIKTP